MKNDTSRQTSTPISGLFAAAFLIAAMAFPTAANGDSEDNGDEADTPADVDNPPSAATDRAAEAPENDDEEWERLGRGLRYRDLHVGEGESPDLWASVFVHYRIYSEHGLLLENTFAQRNPQRFTIGSGLMPAPLELGVKTMKEQGRRELLIPAEMFEPEDFRHHADEHGGDLSQVEASLRPGMLLRAELSLMWVRQYDPTDRHRFR